MNLSDWRQSLYRTPVGMYVRFVGIPFRLNQNANYYTLQVRGQTLGARREIHEWLGECESSPAVKGWRRRLQDLKSRRKFRDFWKQCAGWFANFGRSCETNC